MIRTAIAGMDFVFQTVHQGLVRIDGDRTFARFPITEWGRRGESSVEFLGFYDDQAIRTDEGWRFASRYLAPRTLGRPTFFTGRVIDLGGRSRTPPVRLNAPLNPSGRCDAGSVRGVSCIAFKRVGRVPPGKGEHMGDTASRNDDPNRPKPDELASFRADALRFLETHARRRADATPLDGASGPDAVGLLDGHDDRAEEAAALERSRAWRRLVFDSGFGWLGGPVELGGGGRSAALDEEYRLLERAFDVPDQQPFATGTRLVAPAVLAHGSADCSGGTCPASSVATCWCASSSANPRRGRTSLRCARERSATATSGW